MSTQSKFLNSFSTPIYVTYLDTNISNNVEEIIIPKLSKLESTETLNTDFFSEKIISENELPDFFNFINKELDYYSQATTIQRGDKFQYWVQDYKPDQFQGYHKHPGSTISGVYFIRSNNAGPIQFKNPNPYMEFTQWNHHSSIDKFVYFNIKPSKGMLLLFPSWLKHGISKNETDETRISISFNLYFDRGVNK